MFYIFRSIPNKNVLGNGYTALSTPKASGFASHADETPISGLYPLYLVKVYKFCTVTYTLAELILIDSIQLEGILYDNVMVFILK